MPSTASRQPSETEHLARLSARIEALEDRVRRLEAHVRRSTASRPSAPSVKKALRPVKSARSSRPRPRCPGCTLELPPGARGESCVWCGFLFEAVRRGRGKARR